MNKNNKKFSLYEETTKQIIEILESHKASGFTNNWFSTRSDIFPINPISGTKYRGINIFYLCFIAEMKGYSQNRWATWNQIIEQGGNVKENEAKNYTRVTYFSFVYKDERGKDVTKLVNEILKKGGDIPEGVKSIPYDKYYRVYNLDQCENLPESLYAKQNTLCFSEFDKDELAEEFLTLTEAKINYVENHIPCYRASTDEIIMPLARQYKGKEHYYSDIMHELGHWTGHQSRLNREKNYNRKSKEYAFEELIAELFSAFVCAGLGFTTQITNNAAYIESWLTNLKSDVKFVYKASKDAQIAAEFAQNRVEARYTVNALKEAKKNK
ncbi:MAG: DUF1738 domain-containing protein [Ignavibacteria bacterium]|nr:DUF1738 domain-containing protein [Ignavibacteria bacterium]